jgi:hypothetical protein
MNKDMQVAIDKGWVSLFNENPRLKQELQMMTVEGLQGIYSHRDSKVALAEQYGLKEYQVEKFVRIVLQEKQDCLPM